MMTRKDYVEFAEIINEAQRYWPKETNSQSLIVDGMCDIFWRDNPNFNRAKFLEACEGDSYPDADTFALEESNT